MSIAFAKLIQGFLENLKKNGMTHNTYRNYKSDLETFKKFLQKNKLDFQSLDLKDLEGYLNFLKKEGLKPNSQRRKLLTVKTFLKTVSLHIDVELVGAEKMIAPEKIEKPPRLVPMALVEKIRKEQETTPMGARNRALIGLLVDTGALVTEILALKKENIFLERNTLNINGKRPRQIPFSAQTALDLKELLGLLRPDQHHLFYSFNKAGMGADVITPRGVELLFKTLAKAYCNKHFKPRVLRHIFVMNEFALGKSEQEIMASLGLRTSYSFRIYRPLFQLALHHLKDDLKNPLDKGMKLEG